MKCLAFILLFLCMSNAFGQNMPMVDSLNRELTLAKQDTSRVLILSELAFQYRFANIDTAMMHAQNALKLSRLVNYRRGEAAALNNIAFLFREKGNLPLAMELHFKVQQLASDNHLHNEGALSMMRLGNIYRDLRDYNAALIYQRQAITIFERSHYKRGLAISTMLIGLTFLENNQLDSALHYENQAQSMIDTSKFSDITSTMLYALGKIHAKLHNYQTALRYYRQSARTSRSVNDHRSLTQVYANLGQLFGQLEEVDSSIFYANEALAIAQKASNKAGILNAATVLSQIYEPLDIKKALEYYKLTVEAKDSLYGNEKIMALQTVKFNEQERQRNFEIERKAYQDKMRQYALIAGLGSIFIVAVVLYKNNRQKQKTNTLLQKTLADLKLTQAQLVQSEKMASLGELTAGIAHEIQNPLNFVNNFSDLNVELIEEMRIELKAGNREGAVSISNDIADNEQKINIHGKRADVVVKGMLQHSRPSAGIKESVNINALTREYFHLSYQGQRAKDKSFNATMKTDFDESIGNIKIIPQDIGRAILNVFNNSFYAVSEKRKLNTSPYEPTVTVSTKKVDSTVEIRIWDNGAGIPEKILDKIYQPFFTTKPAGHGTGLGLSLSYDVIKAHGGDLTVNTIEGEYAEFIIHLSLGDKERVA